jgi:hypothetical protein
MKLKKKGNFASHFTSPEKEFFFIYDVIMKQMFLKRSTNHYFGVHRARARARALSLALCLSLSLLWC